MNLWRLSDCIISCVDCRVSYSWLCVRNHTPYYVKPSTFERMAVAIFPIRLIESFVAFFLFLEEVLVGVRSMPNLTSYIVFFFFFYFVSWVITHILLLCVVLDFCNHCGRKIHIKYTTGDYRNKCPRIVYFSRLCLLVPANVRLKPTQSNHRSPPLPPKPLHPGPSRAFNHPLSTCRSSIYTSADLECKALNSMSTISYVRTIILVQLRVQFHDIMSTIMKSSNSTRLWVGLYVSTVMGTCIAEWT